MPTLCCDRARAVCASRRLAWLEFDHVGARTPTLLSATCCQAPHLLRHLAGPQQRIGCLADRTGEEGPTCSRPNGLLPYAALAAVLGQAMPEAVRQMPFVALEIGSRYSTDAVRAQQMSQGRARGEGERLGPQAMVCVHNGREFGGPLLQPSRT